MRCPDTGALTTEHFRNAYLANGVIRIINSTDDIPIDLELGHEVYRKTGLSILLDSFVSSQPMAFPSMEYNTYLDRIMTAMKLSESPFVPTRIIDLTPGQRLHEVGIDHPLIDA